MGVCVCVCVLASKTTADIYSGKICAAKMTIFDIGDILILQMAVYTSTTYTYVHIIDGFLNWQLGPKSPN